MPTLSSEPRFTSTPELAAPVAERPRGVRLLHVDEDLAAAVPDELRATVGRLAVAPLVLADPGAWDGKACLENARGAYAALLIDGLMTREVRVGARVTTHLIGPGDIFNPFPSTEAALPATVEWRVEEPVRLAVLDDRFAAATARVPALGTVVQRRLAAQLDRMAVTCAVTALPRVEERVLALFWHLAERWGRVGRDGVTVPLKLTHAAIGCLVGAQRPTISLALRDLAEAGTLTRAGQTDWLLAPGSELTLAA